MKNNINNLNPVSVCPYANQCAGCPWMGRELSWQLEKKKEEVLRHFLEAAALDLTMRSIFIHSTVWNGMRDHADLTLYRVHGQRRIGLFKLDQKEIIDLEVCPLMSPALALWFQEVRAVLPSIQFGHFRIRVAPDGTRGIWLDFPNLVLNYFLEEQIFFSRLFSKGVVEFGQKTHRLQKQHGELKSGIPELHPWFQTFHPATMEPIKIFGTISSFSQPGFLVNKILIERVFKKVREFSSLENWIELGCGSGNFTLPLAAIGNRVHAVEMHPMAIRGLLTSLNHAGLVEQVQVIQTNFHQPSQALWQCFKDSQGLLVDPPRSGLGPFLGMLKNLSSQNLPKCILYLSCFSKTLAADSRILLNMGYYLIDLEGIDQFPNSPHCEWLAVFARDS